ncbi:MAG: type III-B CRISPR module RAMP protein Cmr6 [Opitutaceae bacterium]|jgi:CRISPR-associated protein Cmr6|nr:type III-B CRISPR module RAMP protein Cmr6 [Opitutaceae bacterium]
MSTPLPEKLRTTQTTCPDFANTGLWYDKFCNTWSKSWTLKSESRSKDDSSENNPKLDWIRTVTDKNGKRCGDAALLTEHTFRRLALVEAHGGKSGIFSNVYRFVSGLGREHPVENGFAWHHTLGTPYLPGSSVKGAVRSFLATWMDTPEPETTMVTSEISKEEITHILGPRAWKDEQGNWHDTEHTAGTVIFLDAIPVERPLLKADVMTPHYDPYYQDVNGKTAPGDWHSPIPIPFLTVAPGAKFLFAVLPRRANNTNDQEDCKKIINWLGDALQTVGAGAKTAIGYGRFSPDIVPAPVPAPALAPAPDRLFDEIARVQPQNAAQIVDQILNHPDATLKEQLVTKFREKIATKEFKNTRQKAAGNPGHWLNKLKTNSTSHETPPHP